MTPEVTLASDAVRVRVRPDRGGKIVGLEHKPSRREWLLESPGGYAAPPQAGMRFTDAPMYGWDEMIPTIDACANPADPAGPPLPDHGEAWSRPWSAERRGDATLRCVTAGRALPYRLVRDVTVHDRSVVLDYELTASAPLSILWAAHPQLVLDPAGTAVVLPATASRLIDVDDPAGPRVDRGVLEDPLAAVAVGRGRKLYVDPEVAVDEVMLADRRGPWLRFSWDRRKLPYLGVWIDHGAFAHRPVVAVEPSNAFYDSLERALRLGRAAAVDPERARRWRVLLELGAAGG